MALARGTTMESCAYISCVSRSVYPCNRENPIYHAVETDNSEDGYAVAYYKSEEVVDHVPKKILRLCAAVLRQSRAMKGTVIGIL